MTGLLRNFFHTSFKHKKLSEDWVQLQTSVGEGVTFACRDLGSTMVTEAQNEAATAEAIKRVIHLVRATHAKPKRVALQVSSTGVKVRSAETGEMLKETDIYDIAYCSADSHFNHVVAFIANGEKSVFECYAYLCQSSKMAQTVAVSIAHAFNMVYNGTSKINEVDKKEKKNDTEDSTQENFLIGLEESESSERLTSVNNSSSSLSNEATSPRSPQKLISRGSIHISLRELDPLYEKYEKLITLPPITISPRNRRKNNQHSNQHRNQHSNQLSSQHSDQQSNQQSNQHSNQLSSQHNDQHSSQHSIQHSNQHSNQHSSQHNDQHGQHSDEHKWAVFEEQKETEFREKFSNLRMNSTPNEASFYTKPPQRCKENLSDLSFQELKAFTQSSVFGQDLKWPNMDSEGFNNYTVNGTANAKSYTANNGTSIGLTSEGELSNSGASEVTKIHNETLSESRCQLTSFDNFEDAWCQIGESFDSSSFGKMSPSDEPFSLSQCQSPSPFGSKVSYQWTNFTE